MKQHLLIIQSIRIPSLAFAATILFLIASPIIALERVNLDTSGAEMTGGVAFAPTVSGDGRYVVFDSNADLVPEKTSPYYDIYIRDRQLNTTTRISVDGVGTEANGNSSNAVISADGQFVAFQSDAGNLVSGDANGIGDIFVKNLSSGAVERVSVATGGAEATLFPSDSPSISGDGRYVVFSSGASDLVTMDTNSQTDIFLRDRQSNTTTRINLGLAGVEASGGESFSPVISDNGSAVAFRSFATNLISPASSGNASIFVRDLGSNTTSLVSKSTGGAEADFDCDAADISADGNLVLFVSGAANLDPADTDMMFDLFLHDRQAATTQVVSLSSDGTKGNGESQSPRISGDGTRIGFTSDSTNLVTGDTNGKYDLFVRTLASGVTQRFSVGPNGEQADDHTFSIPDFTADGGAIAFESSAGNLVANDTNMTHDIFYGAITQPTDPTVNDPAGAAATAAQRAVIQKQIKSGKKKLKAAKRSGKKAKVKRYKKQLKKLKAKLNAL